NLCIPYLFPVPCSLFPLQNIKFILHDYLIIKLETIVNQILTAKKSDPKADTTALETEIDQLVYQLYELTAEEIKIIEG
ncbi:hypothetical protein, partial [Cuspidothrix issatschenkoi]|uniref:hypothetical protein n=1 Tax=Cuspidothrix issatschenkoi TaxID=230752 RepID=UPI001D157EC5